MIRGYPAGPSIHSCTTPALSSSRACRSSRKSVKQVCWLLACLGVQWGGRFLGGLGLGGHCMSAPPSDLPGASGRTLQGCLMWQCSPPSGWALLPGKGILRPTLGTAALGTAFPYNGHAPGPFPRGLSCSETTPKHATCSWPAWVYGRCWGVMCAGGSSAPLPGPSSVYEWHT